MFSPETKYGTDDQYIYIPRRIIGGAVVVAAMVAGYFSFPFYAPMNVDDACKDLYKGNAKIMPNEKGQEEWRCVLSDGSDVAISMNLIAKREHPLFIMTEAMQLNPPDVHSFRAVGPFTELLDPLYNFLKLTPRSE